MHPAERVTADVELAGGRGGAPRNSETGTPRGPGGRGGAPRNSETGTPRGPRGSRGRPPQFRNGDTPWPPASSLAIIPSFNKPCAATLPHSAPSVAILTASGCTLSAVIPRRCRCVIQASSSGNRLLSAPRQKSDPRPREAALAHIIECRRVDHIVPVAGPEQRKKVEPAPAIRGHEPGEAMVADLRANAVRRLLPGRGDTGPARSAATPPRSARRSPPATAPSPSGHRG